MLKGLQKEYGDIWDYDRIFKEVSQEIMQESLEKRAARKKEKEEDQKQRSIAWQKKKAENIVFIGKGYSGALCDKETNEEKLSSLGLLIITSDHELADFLQIDEKTLRFLCYHLYDS